MLNNALPWPDEAARFCMLWLTGLMAPVALRQGGFVAIDTLATFLPRRGVAVLALLLFMVSLLVLIVAAQLGWKHVNSGWLFASASLKLPLHLIGLKAIKIKLAWMYMSLFIGVWLIIAVNLEMILRQVLVLGRQDHLLRPNKSRRMCPANGCLSNEPQSAAEQYCRSQLPSRIGNRSKRRQMQPRSDHKRNSRR